MAHRLFVAIMVHGSTSIAPSAPPLYEEEIILFEADSEEEARTKALDYAKKQEGSYHNQFGDTITRRFIHLVDVQQALYDKIEDGTPIYSRHFRNLDAYRSFDPFLSGEEL